VPGGVTLKNKGEGKTGHWELPTGPKTLREGWVVDGRIDALSFNKWASLGSQGPVGSRVPGDRRGHKA
jgi:hypothetical protein